MAEKQTVPHLNALMCGSKIQREQPCRSVRGCHATSPLKSVLFRRKVVWQPLIELYCCTWHILEPTSRATKWGIICFPSLSGSLSNPLRLKMGKVGVEQNRNTVYELYICSLVLGLIHPRDMNCMVYTWFLVPGWPLNVLMCRNNLYYTCRMIHMTFIP